MGITESISLVIRMTPLYSTLRIWSLSFDGHSHDSRETAATACKVLHLIYATIQLSAIYSAWQATLSAQLVVEFDGFWSKINRTAVVCSWKKITGQHGRLAGYIGRTSLLFVLLLCETLSFRNAQILVCSVRVVVGDVIIAGELRIDLLARGYARKWDMIFLQLFDVLLGGRDGFRSDVRGTVRDEKNVGFRFFNLQILVANERS